MKDAVTNKIRLLKNIKPNPDWLQSEKGNLLFEISQSGKQAKSAWKLPGFLVPDFAFKESLALKPVLAFCLILGLIFGGGFLTVLAAKDSLPGELLYPVKIAVEKTKVRVSSQETKTKLQAEYVGTRVEELSQIIEETKDPIEKKEKVVKTVNKLQAQIASTKAHLEKVKEQAELEKVAGAVEAVSEKTIQAGEALEKIVENLNKEESQEVVEVIDAAIRETSAFASELEQTKKGIEVQMEVKEIKELPVEIFNEASVSFENIIGD